jgi:hypothetical protein
MALLDLSLVTETLVNVVRESIEASSAWPTGQIPDVSGLPPDALTGGNAVGIYLYHLAEEAGLKNQAWPGRPAEPIRYSPMGLNLFYVLSARSNLLEEGNPNLAPFREQLLMGLAVKALHDNPIIDDATTVAGVAVMPAGMRNAENQLRLELRNVPPNEAVSYWTAGSSPLRLCAYYEVRVVLLEPEEPPTAAGRVYLYHVLTFVSGLPRLATSRSVITFTIPGEGTPRRVEVQPAQCAPDTELVLVGVNLAGDRVALLVRASGWEKPVEADPGWGVGVSGDRLFATVRATVGSATVLPGTYGASVTVVRSFAAPQGPAQEIAQTSNETPFTVTPGVTAISGVSATGVFTLTGGIFEDPGLVPGSVRVLIGDAQLAVGTAGSLAPGQFAVLDRTRIEVRLPAGLLSGAQLPVRILINGAESPPRWVAVP